MGLTESKEKATLINTVTITLFGVMSQATLEASFPLTDQARAPIHIRARRQARPHIILRSNSLLHILRKKKIRVVYFVITKMGEPGGSIRQNATSISTITIVRSRGHHRVEAPVLGGQQARADQQEREQARARGAGRAAERVGSATNRSQR